MVNTKEIEIELREDGGSDGISFNLSWFLLLAIDVIINGLDFNNSTYSYFRTLEDSKLKNHA